MRFALTLSLASILCAGAAAQPHLQKWEYKTFRPDHGGPGNDDELNKLGADGWELIAVFREGNNLYHYTFKRPKLAEGKAKPANDDPQNVKLAMAKAQTLTNACMAYKLKTGDFPEALKILADTADGKPYLNSPKELLDPWGKPFKYDPAGKRHNGLKPDIWTETPAGKTVGNWREEEK